jgi:hypothetical protein
VVQGLEWGTRLALGAEPGKSDVPDDAGTEPGMGDVTGAAGAEPRKRDVSDYAGHVLQATIMVATAALVWEAEAMAVG